MKIDQLVSNSYIPMKWAWFVFATSLSFVGGAFAFGAIVKNLENRVTYVEKGIEAQGNETEKLRMLANQVNERLSRMEGKLDQALYNGVKR